MKLQENIHKIGSFISSWSDKMSASIERLEKRSLPKIESGSYRFCFERSGYVKWASITFIAIAILLSLFFIIFINSTYLKCWVPLFSLILLSLAAISSPVAVHISKHHLEIHALVEVTRIKLSSIEHIYSLNSTYARIFIIPVSSTLGLFGFNGRYYDIRHRCWVKSICSEYKNLIMIECIGKKHYIISATDREDLMKEVTDAVSEKKQEIKMMLAEYRDNKRNEVSPKKF